MAREFKSGDKVEQSGIYRVVHDTEHAQEHEVTCVRDEPFPPCRRCGSRVRFVLVRAAQHIKDSEYFAP